MNLALRKTTTLVVLMSLAPIASASQTRKPAIQAKPVQEIALAGGSSSLGSMVGTWTLRNGEKPRTDIKMVFRPNGTFAFVGPNWQSAGKFRVQDHKLRLEWTSVDGAKVAPGVMKKDYPMAEDESSFTIDKYTYYKFRR
jgi:hypothetical protein